MPQLQAVVLEYQDKLEALHSGMAQAHAKQSSAVMLVVLLAAAFVLLCYSRRSIPVWAPPVALAAAVWPVRNLVSRRRDALRNSRRRRFYLSGLERLNGEWQGKGPTGEEFDSAPHLYSRDLNLFGAGSMFELLCTARTQAGRRRLASYLLDLPDREETLARQEAAKELEPRGDLREAVSLLGQFSFLECEWQPFREWLEAPPVTVPGIVAWVMAALSIALALLVLIPWLAPVGAGLWTKVVPYLIAAGAVQAVLAIWIRPKVAPVMERTRRVGQDLEILWRGLDLVQTQCFKSPKLAGLAERIKGGGHAVRRLDRLVGALDQCNQQWFYAVSRLLLIDSQIALAAERWKARYKERLSEWLEAWAEFEALNALGCYTHEHPDDVFPEVLDEGAVFEASGLAHPLLPESAVRNDICINAEQRFYLVSGSNMAGKSTLLRAIGLNAVLASAGAPVRAASARLSAFAVGSCVSIVDSLGEGKSKFMAEVERLRQILAAASGPKPVLFVIDEILSGTNSRDRHVAAESFLRALIAAGAVGALSTHDLALAEIAEDPVLHGANVHMESSDPADPFAFDYRLKAGVSTHSNGLAIARMAGVAVM